MSTSSKRRRTTRFTMLLAVVLVSGAFGADAASAQSVSLYTLGSTYTQDFNTLSHAAGSTMNNLTLPGWELSETGGDIRDNGQYAVDTGASTSGDTYSYGAAGAGDRGLGELRSGTLISRFGAAFTNNTGSTITSLDVGYTGEEWRLGGAGRADRLSFEYSTDTTALDYGTWVAVPALSFVTPDTVTVGAKNGNAASERTALTSSVSGLSIPNGSTFWVRWTDADVVGADDGLAVDDFSLTPRAAAPLPGLSVSDVTANEGDAGTTSFDFTVRLSAPAGPGGVTFDIASTDGTATAPSDLTATALTARTIPAGSSTYTFSVPVNGDTAVEPDETFFADVTNVRGASVTDGRGQGTILNDDTATAPVVDAGGPYSVGEGGSVQVTATGDGATYAWDLDGDGSFETAGQTVTFSAAGLDGPATRTIRVRATDANGLTTDDDATVAIVNAAPSVATPVVSAEPSQKGKGVSVSATFSDPAPSDGPFTCTVDYGDGSGAHAGTVAGRTCTGAPHTYAAVGTYTVVVSVTDKDGGTGSNSVKHAVVKRLPKP